MFKAKTDTTFISNMKKWRSKAFTLIAGFFTIVLLIVGSFEFFPAWVLRDPNEDVHLWHISELGALAAIFLGGIMFGLVRRPQEKPLLAQFIMLSAIVLAVGIMPFDIKAAGLLLIPVLIAFTYPRPRALLSFSREGHVSKLLLGLSLLMALFLLPVAWRELHWQIIGMTENDVHALDLHWIGSAVLITLLIAAGMLSSTKRPGWEQLGIITGATYCYLGVIAMILQNDYAGSWGGAGGLFTIIAGICYILFTILEVQRAKEIVLAPGPAPVSIQEAQPQHLAQKLDETFERKTGQLIEV